MVSMDAAGPQQIAPVLKELHQLIGFDSGGYVYPRSDGELEVFMENPDLQAAMPDYFEPRILRSEQQVLFRSSRLFDEAVRRERGVLMLHQLVKVPLTELQRSDFYNVILRPGGVEDGLSLALRTSQGQGIGILKLYRRGGDRPFTPQEAAALAQLETVLARALRASSDDDEVHESEVSGQGLLVVTPMGRVSFMAPGTETLLTQAFGSHWRGCGGDELPPSLHVLVQQLFLPIPSGPLPHIRFRNAHGWFSLHAASLTSVGGQGHAAAVHVIRRVARNTRLTERLRMFALPRRQVELAYWLARNLPESQVAERMGVSVNTVAYHRRMLYAALGVQDRQGLIERLKAPHRRGGSMARH